MLPHVGFLIHSAPQAEVCLIPHRLKLVCLHEERTRRGEYHSPVREMPERSPQQIMRTRGRSDDVCRLDAKTKLEKLFYAM